MEEMLSPATLLFLHLAGKSFLANWHSCGPARPYGSYALRDVPEVAIRGYATNSAPPSMAVPFA